MQSLFLWGELIRQTTSADKSLKWSKVKGKGEKVQGKSVNQRSEIRGQKTKGQKVTPVKYATLLLPQI